MLRLTGFVPRPARCQCPALVLSATMTLYLHRAERADRLVTALGDLLSNPLPDPFATEIISVPTRGVERWLSQGLAQRLGAAPDRSDGVCAGVDFLPASARGACPRRQRGRGGHRSVAATPRRLAASSRDRRLPRRTLGGAALALSRRQWALCRRRAAPWTALVDRATSGRALRHVRRDPTDHDRQLVSGPRRGRIGIAAAGRPRLAGRTLAAAA